MTDGMLYPVSVPLKAGTTILVEKPFAYVLSSREKGQRCDHCFAKGSVKKCSGCQFAHYCGRMCQKDAWRQHKWECSLLKRIYPKVIPDSARMMARIINLLAKGDGHSRKGYYTTSNFRLWKDLMSHYSDLKNDTKRMEHFTSICVVLFEFLSNTTIPNSAELMGIFGRMCINSFTILDTEMLSVGTGIYLGASIVDHSCSPNAVAVFDGTTINIRITEDIPSFHWSKIFISYIELLRTPFERQTDLLKTYYFLCQCSRCLDMEQISYLHAAKCPTKSCDYPLQIPWKKGIKLYMKEDRIADDKVQGNICLSNGVKANGITNNGSTLNGIDNDIQNIVCKKCNAHVDKEFIDKFTNVMEKTEVRLQDMKNTSRAYVDTCKMLLVEQETLLHPRNVMFLDTLDLAFEACIDLGKWELACQYAKMLIPGFGLLHGPLHPLLGLLHLKYGKILLFLLDSKEALIQLRQAESILKITHGPKHILYKEMLMPLLQQAVSELEGC